jgi:hypothetical protein
MNLKMVSTNGAKARNVEGLYLPEVILTLGLQPEIKSMRPMDKLKYVREFMNGFNHDEFYADLSNDIKFNEGVLLHNMRKKLEIEKPEDFIELYLKVNRDEEHEVRKDLMNELDEIRELNPTAKPAQKQKQKPTLKPSFNDEDEVKHKFKAPKLSL